MTPPVNLPRTPCTDGRLCLRPIGPDDTGDFYAAFVESWETLRPWMNWGDEIHDATLARAHLETKEDEWRRGEAFSFAVWSVADGAFLGMCGLSQCNWRHRFANVGYWVRPSRRGQGVTPTAVRLLAGFSFEVLRLHRLELLVEPANVASQRAAVKLGAREEGLLRARINNQGQPRNALMFSLVPTDLKT